VNAQEDDTSSGPPPGDADRDILAERRARRGEPVGDPILIRRAEAAEAAAQALEERLGGIQQRLDDAEQESKEASQRLAESEQELSRASQRLSDGEIELRSISQRLADRERELQAVSERLGARERELRTVSDRLAEREQQLLHAEREIKGRVEALELRVSEIQEELARERTARQAAQRELEELRAAQLTVQPLVAELKQVAQRLRIAAEEIPAAVSSVPREASAAAESHASPRPTASVQPPASPRAPTPPRASGPTAQSPGGADIAEALAAAVQRLRARVTAVGDTEEQESEGEPSAELAAVKPGPTTDDSTTTEDPTTTEPTPAEASTTTVARPTAEPYVPPLAAGPPQPRPWLAPAIRRVAQRRDPRLAAELVLELLPAQALAVEGSLRYLARIAELGSYEVSLTSGRGSVRELAGGAPGADPAFVLEGPASAFAEVAAGGSKLSTWRPPAGLRVRGRRRHVRRLFAARRAPLVLAELQLAEVTVWPGLLLLALAEAIDPAWTAEHSFTVAFAIEGQQSAVLRVQTLRGRPLAVTRVRATDALGRGDCEPDLSPQTVVRCSERGFARMLSGVELGGETISLQGDREPLQTLLAWTDRVQGVRRFGA
jgi:predicted  nucleic acid-binding Zn-ribbon protein